MKALNNPSILQKSAEPLLLKAGCALKISLDNYFNVTVRGFNNAEKIPGGRKYSQAAVIIDFSSMSLVQSMIKEYDR